MKRGYGQYCPLALAAEILCERWTLLVVSRLIDGCTTFNEIHRGVPRISPSLLSERLARLERAGLVVRAKAKRGTPRQYQLTDACRELDPIIMDLAVWGQRWGRDMTTDDLDPAFLLWSMHMRLDTSTMPPGRTVLEFVFTGAPSDCRRFWLVHKDGVVDMCLKSPGYEIDLRIESDLRLFTEAWRGIRDLEQEIRARRVRVIGPTELRKRFPGWLKLSQLAPYVRQRMGREQRLMATRRSQRAPVSAESATRQPTPATHPE
jgi:DNA-binding HxlR family transcriptional regulator